MAQTLGFGHLPSPHGGRGLIVAVGTVASIVDGGSFAVQLQTAGSNVLRNVLAPIVQVINSVYGTAVVVEASGSSNGYITCELFDQGSGDGVATHAGTVDLSFIAYGGGGSL